MVCWGSVMVVSRIERSADERRLYPKAADNSTRGRAARRTPESATRTLFTIDRASYNAPAPSIEIFDARGVESGEHHHLEDPAHRARPLCRDRGADLRVARGAARARRGAGRIAQAGATAARTVRATR